MNTKSIISAGWRAVVFLGLLALVAFGLSGCATGNTPSAAQTTSVAAAEQAVPDTLVLREGDTVKVAFPGSPNLDTTQMIRRDGKIVMPLIGEVAAAGLTPEKLQANLIQQYAPQISSKEVVVTVASSTFPVFVTGAVIRPGKVLSDHQLTALDAIMEAGGFDFTKANVKDVRIIRNENGVMKKYSVNLKRVLDGQQSHPFYLEPSDIVYVPERLVLF